MIIFNLAACALIGSLQPALGLCVLIYASVYWLGAGLLAAVIALLLLAGSDSADPALTYPDTAAERAYQARKANLTL